MGEREFFYSFQYLLSYKSLENSKILHLNIRHVDTGIKLYQKRFLGRVYISKHFQM